MIESEKSVRATDIELKDRLVAINRVTKVTKGGRHFSFSAIVVVGDEKSIVGHGLGKANEVTEAISKAVEDAKKNLSNEAETQGKGYEGMLRTEKQTTDQEKTRKTRE